MSARKGNRFGVNHSGENKLPNVRSFSILQSGEGSTSFNNDNSANFSGEKKYNEEFRGVYFLTIREEERKFPKVPLGSSWLEYCNTCL